MLCNIGPGDEVILPSFTFVSTANAFALRGARLCFTGIDPGTMNLDPVCVEAAITERTKAIVLVHYGGVSCDLSAFRKIAEKNRLYLIEDAAHCMDAYYESTHLGTVGHLGTISFHRTKNIHCREGGALIINDPELVSRAIAIRDNGTNREDFLNGKVSHYEWIDIGSNYRLNELPAAFLWVQLQKTREVTTRLLDHWNHYYKALEPLQLAGRLELARIPNYAKHNAHLFFIKCRGTAERKNLTSFLKARNIDSHFHYIPLHSSPAGQRFGYFSGGASATVLESGRLLRLPLYYELRAEQRTKVIEAIFEFFESNE
jgi:dTDP-4-amino-4,6-dideoxygalactose transaminase